MSQAQIVTLRKIFWQVDESSSEQLQAIKEDIVKAMECNSSFCRVILDWNIGICRDRWELLQISKSSYNSPSFSLLIPYYIYYIIGESFNREVLTVIFYIDIVLESYQGISII